MSTPTAEERAHARDVWEAAFGRDDAVAEIAQAIRAAVEAEREAWPAWLWGQRQTLAETSYSDEKKEGYRLALQHLEETLAIRARSEGT